MRLVTPDPLGTPFAQSSNRRAFSCAASTASTSSSRPAPASSSRDFTRAAACLQGARGAESAGARE